MSEDADNLEPFLPAPDLRNKPDGGKGPLGKKDFCLKDPALVKNLQKMLKALDYDLGDYGPDGDGVDGAFGELTENAVTDFQEKNRDWDGEQLKPDGLVGPKTSDAMNRAMVGKSHEGKKWDDHYQTPKKLVKGKPYYTVTSDFLVTKGLEIESGGAKEAKIFLTTSASKVTPRIAPLEGETRIRIIGTGFTPASKVIIGINSATDIMVGVGSKFLYATLPPGTEGFADVIVSTPGQKDIIISSGIRYVSDVVETARAVQSAFIVHLEELRDRAQTMQDNSSLTPEAQNLLEIEFQLSHRLSYELVDRRALATGTPMDNTDIAKVYADNYEKERKLIGEVLAAIG